MSKTNDNEPPMVTAKAVPLRTGPPTKEELLEHYPARFTWKEMKTFINSGDLGLLKRDKKLQKRYDAWSVGILQKHGSMVNFLLNYRLRWGQPDTISLLTSEVVDGGLFYTTPANSGAAPTPYFCIDTPPEYYCIIENDWPYSVPSDVEHTVIWTQVPIYHPDLVPEFIKPRVDQDGLWGFTGSRSPPPSPSTLHSCLPSLAEWGVTLEGMAVSSKGTEEEQAAVEQAGSKVAEFVRKRWAEDVWETGWFVNPPRLQSIPHLAHLHVFARRHS